jgi:hypothetical protein
MKDVNSDARLEIIQSPHKKSDVVAQNACMAAPLTA